MQYHELPARGILSGFVECFWTLEGALLGNGDPERIVPDGRTELVWNLADPFYRHRPGTPRRRQDVALLVGQITGPILLEPSGRVDLLAVRIRPEAFGPLLGGIPAHELTDRDVGLDDLFGGRFRHVGEEAAEHTSTEARVAVVASHLERWVRNVPTVDPRTVAAVAAISATHGKVGIDRLAGPLGLSPRQLERSFRRDVGIGPKRLARITRFRRLVARLAEPGSGGWSRLAVQCGYYDQAHLIRDFREFTGATPGEFLDREDTLGEPFLP